MSQNQQQINRTLLTTTSKLEDQLKVSKSLKASVYSHFDNSMYSVMNNAPSLQLFTFEFIAMFIFTFTLCSAMIAYQVDTQAAGAILMAICLTTPFCGANLNPMVTLSNCLKKENKYRWNCFGIYVSGQLLGALAGIFWSEFMGLKLQSQLILEDRDIWKVISNEGMGVFIFIFFMLLLSNPNTTFIENQLTGYMSITLFYHIARSFAPFSNSTLNPAFTIALVIQYATKGQLTSLKHCWAWLVGDLIGCIFATYFYTFIYEPIVRQLRDIRRKQENFESMQEDQEQQDLSRKSIKG